MFKKAIAAEAGLEVQCLCAWLLNYSTSIVLQVSLYCSTARRCRVAHGIHAIHTIECVGRC